MKDCVEEIRKIATMPDPRFNKRTRIRLWAFANAYMLIFLTIMFGISWAITIFVGSSFR